MKPAVIHLGLPKTASTSFQKHLFGTHSQIHYFGKNADGSIPASVRPVLMAKSLCIQPLHPDDIRNTNIRNQLLHFAEHDLTPMLSSEGLSGGEPRRKQQQAELFKQHFGECKIILLLREPISFITSWYSERLKTFQTRSEWENSGWMRTLGRPPCYFDPGKWLEACWERRCSPVHYISYADTANIYADVFGRENVQILFFEEFLMNPERFIRDLCIHLSIDPEEGIERMAGKRENNRITTAYIEQIKTMEKSRILSLLFRKSGAGIKRKLLNPANDSGERFSPELPENWIRKINAVGDLQNRRLIKEWGLPLADYGYRL